VDTTLDTQCSFATENWISITTRLANINEQALQFLFQRASTRLLRDLIGKVKLEPSRWWLTEKMLEVCTFQRSCEF